MGARPLVPVTFEVEIVERAKVRDGTIEVISAMPTLDGLPGMRARVRIPGTVAEDWTPEEETNLIRDLVASAWDRELRELVGLAIAYDVRSLPHPARVVDPMTGEAPSTMPRIPHRDRARLLANLVKGRADYMAATCGADWLFRMLETELATVYADGESHGYAKRVAEKGDAGGG